MITQHKTYTQVELAQKYGTDWKAKVGVISSADLSGIVKPKEVVETFEDFDEATKGVYTILHEALLAANPLQQFSLYATGSRVNGRWKTAEESEAISKVANSDKVKYSDYDFETNASVIPNLQQLAETTGFSFDRLESGSGRRRRVLIPQPERIITAKER